MDTRSAILLENGESYLSNDDVKYIESLLQASNINLVLLNSGSVKQSFTDLIVYISNNLTELLISGLLLPIAYDALKRVFKFILKRIKENAKIITTNGIRDVQPSIIFKHKNTEIIAPLPNNLSDEQFDKYCDSIMNTLCKIVDGQQDTHLFIVQKENTLESEILSSTQYILQQRDKRQPT